MNAHVVPIDGEMQSRFFQHFRNRFIERFGRDVDPLILFRAICREMRSGDGSKLRLIKRVNNQGRRIVLIRLPDGRFVFVLIDAKFECPVTVFTEGMKPRCFGKPFELVVPDEFR